VIYKGVEYSVTATSQPDVWQWRFQVGERTEAGKTRTRLVDLAARRVQMRIDAALRGFARCGAWRRLEILGRCRGVRRMNGFGSRRVGFKPQLRFGRHHRRPRGLGGLTGGAVICHRGGLHLRLVPWTVIND
jgi:hypothetical protein